MRFSAYIFLLAALLLPGKISRGEGTPRILRFEPALIDIDTVRYDAGEIKVRFECVNISDKPVSIIEVRSQCGCLKASFGSGSIAPGKKGHVDAVLDPKGLFASQKRHLTVVATNGDYRKFNTLTLTGYVDRGVTEDEVRYPCLLAPGLRCEVDAVGMRLSQKGDLAVREVSIINTSSETLKLGWTSESGCVRAEIPESLAPGKTARLRIYVNTEGFPSGSYEKSLSIIVDGRLSAPLLLKGAVK